MTSLWTPILEGALQQQANEALFSIADALRDLPAPDGSLSGGAAGLALFFDYLAEAFPDRGYRSVASEFVNRAVQSVDASMGITLYEGIPGVGWVAEHLRRRWNAGDQADPNQEVDAYLHSYLDAAQRPLDFDLIRGLAGWGLYALERLPAPSAASALDRIVTLLIQGADPVPPGLAWWTPPVKRGISERRQGCYDLGAAHGAAGAIAFLANACTRIASPGPAEEATEKAVAWLLAQKRPDDAPIAFPRIIEPDSAGPSGFRSVWCYGDVGISVALLGAARHAKRSDWEASALNVARSAAVRSASASVVFDGCLCHGGAGQAQVFNRIYQATREPLFKEAAQTWIQYTLAQRRGSEGIAGFLTRWMFDNQGNESWLGLPGLLDGAAGIGLTLLAATSSIEPNWDRVFVAAVPPRPVTDAH